MKDFEKYAIKNPVLIVAAISETVRRCMECTKKFHNIQ